ncbi:MAG TPA: zf-HC2 domain-containing protein [Actinomycetota bacterium]|nr:zf-HC2 domain-containing protein [Actinomycetota bacterium]
MSHPGPLLTDYVDGTLAAPTRAEVDAHLRTCAMCRGEVALARAGASATARLRQPVPPPGVGAAAIAEAGRMAAERNPEVAPIAGRARRRPTTPRILAAAGAAAVLLLLVVVAPRLGQGSTSASKEAAGASAGATAYPQATAVEIQHADYSFEALPGVVTQFSRALAPSVGFAAPNPSGEALDAGASSVPPIPAAGNAATNAALLPKATACLNKAFGSPAGTLSRVIRATYAGQPAYLGVYLIGPGAELPPTLLQLSVASVGGCQPLGQTTAKL